MNARSATEMATPMSDGQIRERSVGLGKRERQEVEELVEQRPDLDQAAARAQAGLDLTPQLGRALERAAAAVTERFDRDDRRGRRGGGRLGPAEQRVERGLRGPALAPEPSVPVERRLDPAAR